MSKEEQAIAATEPPKTEFPVFVEAEKMFERLAEITRETAARAYDLFIDRGYRLGGHLDDWLRAEAETLRPTPVKITETTDLVNIEAAVPGFRPDQIEVSLDGDILILSGETTAEEKKEAESTFYNEWRSNRFMRKLKLPCKAEAEGAAATLKDGILYLQLTKAAEEEASKILVKAAG